MRTVVYVVIKTGRLCVRHRSQGTYQPMLLWGRHSVDVNCVMITSRDAYLGGAICLTRGSGLPSARAYLRRSAIE